METYSYVQIVHIREEYLINSMTNFERQYLKLSKQ